MASMSFSDFPEDVQLNILSFLTPAEASAFACTSRGGAALCGAASPLWLAMCLRRWGARTLPLSWAPTSSPFRRLYSVLHRWDPLIGFWRRAGPAAGPAASPSLLLFEWGPSSITASLLAPSRDPLSLAVVKIPFLWLGVSAAGEPVGRAQLYSAALVPVEVNFMGANHIVVEECRTGGGWEESEEEAVAAGSPPDRMTSEIYQYFANRTSPGGDARRQRRRRQLGRQLLQPVHFVKINNTCPISARPLQGLWKGVSEDMKLDFYLVTYDETGGLSCRCVGEAAEPFSGYSPVFWTTSTKFLEPPFSKAEQAIYECREHINPMSCNWINYEMEDVSQILCINSSYDLVIPDLPGSSGDPRNAEGRIWVYEDGTFGFGFLRNKFIIDLKHIAMDGRLLDTELVPQNL